MEGYLIRIPRDAWTGESDKHPRSSSSKKKRSPQQQAQLLYYVLGEGYLRGYLAPDDDEPVDTFQLTSFHVQVDPMYSMLMFEVFAAAKTRGAVPAANAVSQKASKGGSSDDDSGDSSDDDDASTEQQEQSMLLFAANKTIVQTWGTRVLNWNRYVFASFGSPGGGGDDDDDDGRGKDASVLEASRLELLEAFQQHRNASWFARPLSLKNERALNDALVTGSIPTTGGVNVLTSSGATATFNDAWKPGALPSTANAPSKPWWMLNASQTRRISSNSLRK